MISIAPLHVFRGALCSSEATRSFHPEIEASVIDAIKEALTQWKQPFSRGSHSPFESDSVVARNMITAFDLFLSYGFIKGNRTYWLYVKEFMTRSEIDYLKREWRTSCTRQLSIAWLKDSLNKQTLPFYFQCFQQDLKSVRKFYLKEALMTNQALLSRVVQKVMGLLDVQFKFLKPFEKRSEIPLAVMRPTHVEQGPSTSNGRLTISTGYVQEKRSHPVGGSQTELSANSEDMSYLLLDVNIPADFVESLPPTPDGDLIVPENNPDQVFGELLLRKNGESLCGVMYGSKSNKGGNSESMKNENDTGSKKDKLHIQNSAVATPADPFDIALKTSLSKAKLFTKTENCLDREQKLSPVPAVTEISCGDLRLDMGEVIGLNISVFKHDGERFMRMFQVYSNFGTGEAEKRLLALSNHALYLLSLKNSAASKKSYITRAYLPLCFIDYIHVGPDFQVLYLHSTKDCTICEKQGSKLSSVIEICTACKQLGAAILDAIKYAYEMYVASSQPEKIKLNVYTDSTPQHLILHRFISMELHENASKFLGFYLVQWRQTNLYSTNSESYQHSGFLYHKELRSGVSWLLGSNDFHQSYFHLQNKKLYQFSDSTCKLGERVISVRESVTDVTVLKGAERSPHMFEISLSNNTKIQFICQSAADMHKWVSLITLATTSMDMDDEPATCVVCVCENSVLIAQEGLNCAVDGFMRLLVRIDLAYMSQATGVFAAERSACVIRNGKTLEWLLMRSPEEVDRLLEQLGQLGVKPISFEEGGSSRLSAFLNSMPRMSDIFQFTNTPSDDAFDTPLGL